jgi:hypothetical protein
LKYFFMGEEYMMSTYLRMKMILGLGILVLLLTGCRAEPTAAPTAIPTIDPQPTYDVVSTQAVATAFTDLTLNAPTATVIPPTDTPTPTFTPGPTNSPQPTATATQVFIPWTKTPTSTQPAYGCVVTNVSPQSSDTIKVDQDFDGTWTIKNSGTTTWSNGNVDVRYVDGTKFQTGGDLYDLSSDVAPNGTYTVVIDMKAPSSDGSFTSTWGLYMNGGYICQFGMSINVTK